MTSRALEVPRGVPLSVAGSRCRTAATALAESGSRVAVSPANGAIGSPPLAGPDAVALLVSDMAALAASRVTLTVDAPEGELPDVCPAESGDWLAAQPAVRARQAAQATVNRQLKTAPWPRARTCHSARA